jgi:uncharacterized protein (DUF305 family)
MYRRLMIPALALAATASLAACGSDDSSSTDTSVATAEATAGTTAGAVALNEADVEFAQGMIGHHEQAVEMAEIALDPTIAASAEVVDLATRIQAAQEPEIDLMTGWLTAAGESTVMDMSADEMMEMEGMMSVEDMDGLASSSGAEFDTMWLEMMIAHHEGAISQSETVKADGSNPDVLALADQIITAQQAEIAEMQALLQG